MVFGPDADTSWVKDVKLISLEVHDFFAKHFGLHVSPCGPGRAGPGWRQHGAGLGCRTGGLRSPLLSASLGPWPPPPPRFAQAVTGRVNAVFGGLDFALTADNEHIFYIAPELLPGASSALAMSTQ